MPASPTLTVISLGGGAQFSVLALLAGEGAFDRTPDCAIFADTRWEPPSVTNSPSGSEPGRASPLRRRQRAEPLRGCHQTTQAFTDTKMSPAISSLSTHKAPASIGASTHGTISDCPAEPCLLK